MFCKIKIKSRDSKLSWLALAASVFIYCTNLGFLACFSIFYASLLEEFGESKEKTAWLGSIPFALTFFLTPFCLFACRKLSVRLSIIIGTTFTGISLLTTSYAKSINVAFLTFSLLYGIGSSLLFMNTYRAINSYFDKRFSTASGLLTGGTTLLQIPLTQLMVWLLENYSLQVTLQIYAVASTVICFFGSLAYFPTSFETEKKCETSKSSTALRNYKSLLKNSVFCFWTVVQVIICLEYVVSSVHQVQFAIESGVPERTAKQFPFYSAIGASIGRIGIGFILDLNIFDILYSLQIFLFLTGSISLIGSFSTNQTHLTVFIWLFSTADGAFQASLFPVMRALIGTEKFNEGVTITQMASSITIMLGPPLVGLIVDKTKSYKSFFYVAGTPLIIGGLLLFAIRFMKDFKRSTDDDIINKQLNKDSDNTIDNHLVPTEEKEQLFLLQLETNV